MLEEFLLGSGGNCHYQHINSPKENTTLTRSLWNFCQESMVRAIPKGFFVKDSVLSHIMCDLGKTENDTYKCPNIIEDNETTDIVFTEEYILSGKSETKYIIRVITSNKG